jgi:hypothetical protein
MESEERQSVRLRASGANQRSRSSSTARGIAVLIGLDDADRAAAEIQSNVGL